MVDLTLLLLQKFTIVCLRCCYSIICTNFSNLLLRECDPWV